jgi:TonB family protein
MPVDMPDRSKPQPKSSVLPGASSVPESDLAELAALFAAHSGGNFSAEISADLALEIVLNEIVEQACLATGATGAAVILERGGEMVCRASSGVNAPELGARLGSESGLTAECIKTRQVQRCDDALADPRADADASRSLGVRSVMVLPLLRNGTLAGVLEVFSSRPAAFGERDELTLQALAQRILKNLERASQPFIAANVAARNPSANLDAASGANQLKDSRGNAAISLKETSLNNALNNEDRDLNKKKEDEVEPETPEPGPRGRLDFVTFALGAAVLACAVLLATLVGLRLGWRKNAGVRERVTKSLASDAQSGTNATALPAAGGAENSMASDKKNEFAPPSATTPTTSTSRVQDSSVPEGSLSVYENGKEVFRMPPTVPVEAPSGQKEVQQASSVEPTEVVDLSPEAAETSLLHRVEPEYPEQARQQGIQGAVVLDLRIGRDGVVQEVKLVRGPGLLADAAIAAAQQWRFKPRKVDDRFAEMQTRVTLNFKLQH